jgi:aspartate/methionine/tyrosine aminotransferase
MRISTRAQRIEPFYVMEVAKAAGALAREVAHTDRPMIFLNIGEPDFTAPPLVQEAAARAVRAGATQYTQATGLDHLRERISGWYASASMSTCRPAASSSRPALRPRCSWPAWR